MAALRSVSRDNGLIYDVGLHRGEDSHFYLRKGFRVIAFEANPDLVDYNRKKFAGQIDSEQLIIVEGAIVERPASTEVAFYRNLNKTEWGTVDVKWAERNEVLGTRNELIPVKAVDFSECIETFGMPYYMKIDIEGLDTVCLRCLTQFDSKPEYVSFESSIVSYEKVLEDVSLLESLGYAEFMVVQQQNIHTQRVPKPAAEGAYVPHKFKLGSSGLFGKELQGTWKTKEEILEEYEIILDRERRFGNDTFWQQNRLTRAFLNQIVSRVRGAPLTGWFDIHARLRPGT